MARPATSRPPTGPLSRYLLAIACVVVIVAGLRAAAAFFIPVLLAFFLAILAFPFLFWLREKKVPGPLAVFLATVALMLVVAGVLLMGFVALDRMVRTIPLYQAEFEAFFLDLQARLGGLGVDTSDWLSEEVLDFDRLLGIATDAFTRVATLVAISLLVILITVFVFAEALDFPKKMALALGKKNDVLERFNRINTQVQRYIFIKTAVSLATGLAVGLLVLALDLDLPIFFGLVAFLLNYIPNIGSVLAAVPAVALALVKFGPGYALVTAAGYVLINILLGNLAEPNLMGRRLGLAPIVVLLSLLFWGWMWGVVGALLAVPLTMVLKILFENTEQLRWLAKLMDRGPTRPPPTRSRRSTRAAKG